jgi:hypothetical protein
MGMAPEPGKAKLCGEGERLSEVLLVATAVLGALERWEDSRPEMSLEPARANWHGAGEAFFAHLREHG